MSLTVKFVVVHTFTLVFRDTYSRMLKLDYSIECLPLIFKIYFKFQNSKQTTKITFLVFFWKQKYIYYCMNKVKYQPFFELKPSVVLYIGWWKHNRFFHVIYLVAESHSFWTHTGSELEFVTALGVLGHTSAADFTQCRVIFLQKQKNIYS